MVEDKRIVRAMDAGCSFKTEADKEKYLRVLSEKSFNSLAFWLVWLLLWSAMLLFMGFLAGAKAMVRYLL